MKQTLIEELESVLSDIDRQIDSLRSKRERLNFLFDLLKKS